MHDPILTQRAAAGDGGGLWPLVDRLAQLAEQTRQIARRLESTTTQEWQSVAAQRFRHQLAGEALSVRRATAGLDEARRALASHCTAVSG
jgi:hypothetical protein